MTTPIKIGDRKNESSDGVSVLGTSKDADVTGISNEDGAGAVKDVLILLPVSMFLCTSHIKYIGVLTERMQVVPPTERMQVMGLCICVHSFGIFK